MHIKFERNFKNRNFIDNPLISFKLLIFVLNILSIVIYSYNNNVRDLTKMVVTVELPDSNITADFPIERDGISRDRTIDIPNVWGTINLRARGRGQALAQLDLTYGVDVESKRDIAPKECFDLKIKEFYHGRNKSEIVTKSCFKWKCTDESQTSGYAMLVSIFIYKVNWTLRFGTELISK